MMEFVRSEIGVEPIVAEAYFPASPARVFAAWTDPDIVMKWFGMAPNSLVAATIDLRVGGHWEFIKSEDASGTVKFEGTYVAIKKNERLVFSWSFVSESPTGERQATPPSQVEVTFVQNGAGTDVRLVHSSISDEATCTGFAKGWDAAFGSISQLF